MSQYTEAFREDLEFISSGLLKTPNRECQEDGDIRPGILAFGVPYFQGCSSVLPGMENRIIEDGFPYYQGCKASVKTYRYWLPKICYCILLITTNYDDEALVMFVIIFLDFRKTWYTKGNMEYLKYGSDEASSNHSNFIESWCRNLQN